LFWSLREAAIFRAKFWVYHRTAMLVAALMVYPALPRFEREGLT
jgi:hypothetical protein